MECNIIELAKLGHIAADDVGMKNIDEPRESWRSQFDVKGAAQ